MENSRKRPLAQALRKLLSRVQRATRTTIQWIPRSKRHFEVVQSVVTTCALLVGGLWAYSTFLRQREGVPNVTVSLTSTVLPYDKTHKFVVSEIALTNTGKVKVEPGTDGIIIGYRRVPPDLKTGTLVTWKEGTPIPNQFHAMEANILRVYDPRLRYELEPGGTYHERESVVLEVDQLIMIKVSFSLPDGDAVTEYNIVSTKADSLPKAGDLFGRSGAPSRRGSKR